MRNPLITVLQKLNFVSRFLNSFPVLDFNIKGCFYDKEFIEDPEIPAPPAPVISAPPDIEVPIGCEPSLEAISFI